MKRILIWVALVATWIFAPAEAADRMVGLRPADGLVCLAKEFVVAPGTTLSGIRFVNNDSRTVFPSVVVVEGPVRSPGAEIVRVEDVRETAAGEVTVLWQQPMNLQGALCHVRLQLPEGSERRGAGSGAGIGAWDVAEPTGSYILGGTSDAPVPIRVDLAIDLLAGGAAKAGAGAQPETRRTDAASLDDKIVVNSSSSNVHAIRFGLTRPGLVRIGVHDIRGRRIHAFPSEWRDAGRHIVVWDGRVESGDAAASGIYVVQLSARHVEIRAKFVHVRR